VQPETSAYLVDRANLLVPLLLSSPVTLTLLAGALAELLALLSLVQAAERLEVICLSMPAKESSVLVDQSRSRLEKAQLRLAAASALLRER
jgi:uncharacterized membrane protein